MVANAAPANFDNLKDARQRLQHTKEESHDTISGWDSDTGYRG